MVEKQATVWVWLPMKTTPVKAGEFWWRRDMRVGKFKYDTQYVGLADKFALDPIALPLKHSILAETRQNGIFGVFRDSGPDSWGREQLVKLYGAMDEFDLLIRSPADGVGAILIGDVNRSFHAYTLQAIDDAFASMEPTGLHDLDSAVHPTTSVGGAKQKLTVIDNGQYWIAKFPDATDSKYYPHNEHTTLEMAKACHIVSAESRIHILPTGGALLLVRRFDWENTPAGVIKNAFASADTVLGMTGDVNKDSANKSYPRYADAIDRWSQHKETAASCKRELWSRMAYNALVGNADDHTRNHGLLRIGGRWQLSPAFDIVASVRSPEVPMALSMQIDRGSRVATPESLVSSAKRFELKEDEAAEILQAMARTIMEQWRDRMRQVGVPAHEVDRLASAFRLVNEVITWRPDATGPRRVGHLR